MGEIFYDRSLFFLRLILDFWHLHMAWRRASARKPSGKWSGLNSNFKFGAKVDDLKDKPNIIPLLSTSTASTASMWNETHRSQDSTQGFGLLRFTHLHSREFVGMFQHNEWDAPLETQPEARTQVSMWPHHAKKYIPPQILLAKSQKLLGEWFATMIPSLMTPRDSEDLASPKCETALSVKMYVQYYSRYSINIDIDK